MSVCWRKPIDACIGHVGSTVFTCTKGHGRVFFLGLFELVFARRPRIEGIEPLTPRVSTPPTLHVRSPGRLLRY